MLAFAISFENLSIENSMKIENYKLKIYFI